MMKLLQKAFPLVLILFSFVIGDKIAVTTKVKGTVELMAVGNKEYLILKPGTVLSDGDKIRTGKSGFTAVIFAVNRRHYGHNIFHHLMLQSQLRFIFFIIDLTI